MNYNQNNKIAQITSQTLIIGVDIAKHKHVARAQESFLLFRSNFFLNREYKPNLKPIVIKLV
ncbi:MAG: hypothetical protein ACQEWV_03485 [Bacillota bacterium]